MTPPDELAALLGPPSVFDSLELASLRRRRSYKWTAYPADVLPAFVAEMDLPLAGSVQAALARAVADSDCGYAREDELAAVFARFALERWGWAAAPDRMVLVPDVMAGVARGLEILTAPGDRVILTPPVYGPFRRTIERLGRAPVTAAMVNDEGVWRLDLDSIAVAFAAGATAIVLCNPHNPTGSVPTRDELRALAELAARHGAGIVSDEVHAPLTLTAGAFTPLLTLGELKAVTVTSASKAWNVAGLKCALVVGGDPATSAALNALPVELRHPGHLGVLAAMAAYAGSAAGDRWLERVNSHLARQHQRAAALIGAALPRIRLPRVDAGYLLWLDCRDLGLGDDPAGVFLERGRVALSPGLEFGAEGAGFARLNVATSGPLLLEAVRRMQSAAEDRSAGRAGDQKAAGSVAKEPVTR